MLFSQVQKEEIHTERQIDIHFVSHKLPIIDPPARYLSSALNILTNVARCFTYWTPTTYTKGLHDTFTTRSLGITGTPEGRWW